MIELSGKRNAFFTIKSINTNAVEAISQDDIMTLSVTEEMDRMTQGTLKLRDQNHVYSRSLKEGVIIEIAWGYKRTGYDVSGSIAEEFGQSVERRGLRAIIMNPSGAADEKGAITYAANFICMDFRGLNESKVWSGMTKEGVVTAVLLALGISPANMEVSFAIGKQSVGPDGERQDESAFRFLVRKSREWRSLFRIGTAMDGSVCAVFIDADRLASSEVVKRMGGGALELRYGTGDGNVTNYSWQCNEGENGAGDNVQIEFVNGEPVFRRFTVENETVVTWQLNMDAVRKEFNDREKKGGIASETEYAISIMEAKDFNEERIKRLFTKVEQTTAPNGIGYSVNARVLGNVYASPPMVATFKAGFPDRLTKGTGVPPKPVTYYLRKATHTIGREGYMTDLEIVDVFILSPTGVLI